MPLAGTASHLREGDLFIYLFACYPRAALDPACPDTFAARFILALTLVAAIQTRLQGILITVTAIGVFIVAMLLIPRMNRAV